MIKMMAATLTVILLSGPALADDEIRAGLLATPVWTYQWMASGTVHKGKVSFVEKDGKLTGIIDVGFKCSNEVTLRADGFDMEACGHWSGHEIQYVRSGNEFKATIYGDNYTILPVQ
jgi:hypothetical protein